MELVYLWVKHYNCFKETGFHFNNAYKFEYDPESSELCIKNGAAARTPNHFFGENISNLSVIVGDNGAGKTTVLRLILDCLASNSAPASPFIAGFFAQDEQELRVYSHELQIRNIECSDIEVVYMDELALKNWSEATKLIYANNMLDIHDYSYNKPGHNTHDLSLGGLMRIDYSSGVENRHIRQDTNPVVHFFNNEVYRQIDFLYHYKQEVLNTEFLFNMINSLRVEITDNDWNRRNLAQSIEKYYPQDKKRNPELLTNISGMPENEVGELLTMISGSFTSISHNNLWKVYIADHLFINAIKDTAEPVTTSDNRRGELECLLKAYRPLSDNEDILTYCREFLVRAEAELVKTTSVFSERLAPYRAFVEWLELESRKLDLEIDAASASFIRILLNDHNKERFRVFFDHYNRTCSPHYFLNFSWGLSTGQSNLLSLYSRLHSVLKPGNDGGRSDKVVNHLDKPCTSILLLIDEADLSFHPKWQVQYISRLLNMLGTIYKSAKVQVILTSHSPMLLSDVPKSNVMYLKAGTNDSANDHAETFGQNIYTLFNDAFFMDLTVGAFADEVIQSVGKELNKLTQSAMLQEMSDVRSEQLSRLEYYEYITGIIGEPVIRKAFETKLQRLKEAYRTEKLKSAISLYEGLSQEDRDRLIDYIIKDNEKDRDQ